MDELREIYLCRHGETDWTISGKHTSTTDLSLNKKGFEQVVLLRKRIQKIHWTKVVTSPRKRAMETCQLMQLHLKPTVDERAEEWNYGEYEGKTSAQIHEQNPQWNLFSDGAPGGESPEEVGARADLLLEDFRKEGGRILLFSHGHFLRVLAARWIGLPPNDARLFGLSVASVSILGFEHSQPILKLWNGVSHLG